jgi:Rieske Fe-S protein
MRPRGLDDPATAVPRRPLILSGLAAAATTTVVGCGSGSKTSSDGPSTNDSLVGASAVPVGGSVNTTDSDGKPIVVSQPTTGTYKAFSAVCTHKGCTVKPAGKQLKCPCHGSVYDAFTGKNLSGPAPSPLTEIPVKESDGTIVPA